MSDLARSFLLALLLCGVAAPSLARADSAGRTGLATTGCTPCHTGGTAPTVTIKGASSLMTGATGTYTVDIVSGATTQRSAGVDVSTTAGTLAVNNGANAAAKLLSNEIVHAGTSVGTTATVTYQFDLVAPQQGGTVTLAAAGLSADGTGGTSADNWAKTTLDVTITSPPADFAGLDLLGVDLMPPPVDLTPPDLTVLPDAVSSATVPVKKDEAKWICGCRLGAPATSPPALALLALGLLAGLALRRRRR